MAARTLLELKLLHKELLYQVIITILVKIMGSWFTARHSEFVVMSLSVCIYVDMDVGRQPQGCPLASLVPRLYLHARTQTKVHFLIGLSTSVRVEPENEAIL